MSDWINTSEFTKVFNTSFDTKTGLASLYLWILFGFLASMINCDFVDAVAEGCIFQKLKAGSKSERRKFDLRTCNFQNTDLKSSIFVMCNLAKLKFTNSILENAVFERCDLEETDFRIAKILGCAFVDCNIKNTLLDVNGFIDYGVSKGFILDNG